MTASLPVYDGPFGPAQAERLLWRAGFGPRPAEARRLAALGLTGAVRSLVYPGAERLIGKPPRDQKGRPLAPKDQWGHDHLWWLDKMVRTSRPLVERMTLVWHDWFATSNDGVGSQRLMLRQNALFRRAGLASFHTLFEAVAIDPAMLLYLSGIENEREAPNENFGREMMELFSLGAASGYTEDDVREQARALTGWTARYRNGYGWTDFRFEAKRHDPSFKVIFGKSGKFGWRDSVRLCVQHPAHAGFFVRKLWGYFVPVDPDAETQAGLEQLYVRNKLQIRPVVGAILRHPLLYEGPSMPKSPVVYTAGLLRRLGQRIDREDWIWLCAQAGQQLFYPPNVSGWDESRWYDTSTFLARWRIAATALDRYAYDPGKAKRRVPPTAAAIVDTALDFWHRPPVSSQTQNALTSFAARTVAAAGSEEWKLKAYPLMAVNGARHLIAVSPELQTA
ncbi:MAG TPA: DUF1800 domain-containing protein [Gaiellaceae bacterium]|nr:DUF1800 domain-containing protein [Gaiellaceae bacterium]